MEQLDVHKIRIDIHEALLPTLLELVSALGIQDALLQNARSVQIKRKQGFLSGLRSNTSFLEQAYPNLSFYVEKHKSRAILQTIAHGCSLEMPGRGSASCSQVQLYCPAPIAKLIRAIPGAHEQAEPGALLHNLVGIEVVVPRGDGNNVAKAAIGIGTCVPCIAFSQGTGFRNRLGLLRITISAEKEAIVFVVPDHDAENVIQTLIEEARLDQPGKGFISAYPIESAILNTRTKTGKQTHAASMEQIITAIDTLNGNTLWRRRFDRNLDGQNGNIPFFRNMTSLVFTAPADMTATLATAAMLNGAPGATSTKVHSAWFAKTRQTSLELKSQTLESTTLVISENMQQAITTIIIDAGAELFQQSGMLEIQQRPLAWTFK